MGCALGQVGKGPGQLHNLWSPVQNKKAVTFFKNFSEFQDDDSRTLKGVWGPSQKVAPCDCICCLPMMLALQRPQDAWPLDSQSLTTSLQPLCGPFLFTQFLSVYPFVVMLLMFEFMVQNTGFLETI